VKLALSLAERSGKGKVDIASAGLKKRERETSSSTRTENTSDDRLPILRVWGEKKKGNKGVPSGNAQRKGNKIPKLERG